MNTKKVDLLLLNRNLAQIEFAIMALEAEGYRLHTASTMRDALLVINQNPISLILCGLELEDISGEQLLSFLKCDPLREAIPFIFFLSMENQNELSPKRVIKAGAEDLIFFPIEESILVSRVKEVTQHARPGGGKPAANGQSSPECPVDTVDDETTGPPDKPKMEKRKDPRKGAQESVAVEVSWDGKSWVAGLILNTSKSGVMIETTLVRNQGDKILLKNSCDEDGCIVAGSVAHILLGDESEQIGMGIVFYRNSEWSGFCERLLSGGEPANVGTIRPELFPITVEVSRDGFLWVDAHISNCDPTRALIKTVMLSKPREIMRIMFEKHGIHNIVVGTIKEVGLEKEELLAKLEIDFEQDSGWFEVFAHFATLANSTAVSEQSINTVPEMTGPEKLETGKEKAAESEEWAKTVLLKQGNDETPESLIQGNNPQKAAAENHRFYQSLIGRKLDNYEVVSFISSGAMGGVLKGWDTALERDVALKVISWELSSQEKFVEMFFKEARFISKLNHPNISQIYHIGNANDILYYAMEFVYGENMLELNKKKVRYHTSQIANYLKTSCLTMDYVWENKIIHRDLKPANIMLTRDDKLKIVDFGVAQLNKMGEKQSEAKIVGSPLYLSPETILNQKLDHRSDIYSLGATFYHLMAGSPPFVDVSLPKILYKHLHMPLPPLKQRAPEISDKLCQIIEKMMAKKIEDRFHGYPEIIQRLEDLTG